MKEQTTLYLADDHQIVIDGLRLLIENESTFKIVGTANDGEKAYEDILRLKPEIALIDLRMPKLNGIKLIINLINKVSTRFIILSMHNDKQHISNAKNIGAFSYLLKNTGKDELIHCLNKVRKGEYYYTQDKEIIQSDGFPSLTPRELEILKLIINEHSTQQIANQLDLSTLTVDTHRKNIWKKTNSKSLVGLIKYAIDNGIDY